MRVRGSREMTLASECGVGRSLGWAHNPASGGSIPSPATGTRLFIGRT